MRIWSLKGVLLATLFIVSIVALAIPIHSDVGQWENLTNAPENVGTNNGHRIEAMGNYIYFWAANSTVFARYNPSTLSWQTLTAAPTNSGYGIGIVRAKDTAGTPAIYIMAGTTSANSQKWYRYTDAGGWSGMLSTSIPWTGSGAQTNCNKPANGSECVWDNGDTIYYFPGSGYEYDRYDWYKYTISTNTWTYMGEFNSSGDPKNGPGNSACFVTYGGENYIYIQFGHTPSGNYTSALFMRYKISTGQWTQMAQTGYGADDGADMVWDGGNYLYLWPGAYCESSTALIDEYRFLRYSISGNTWENLTEQPFKGDQQGNDDGGAGGIVGSYIYKLKGGDGSGSTPAGDFYRYQMALTTPTAWATGPTGSTNNPNVTLTYIITGGSPDNVKLYYTKDGGTSWTWAGTDTSVDGTFAYNITSGDGTYGWNAVAIGGGSTETDPPAGGTPPEAASLILDRAPTLIAPTNGYPTNDNTPTFEWSSVSNPGGVTYQIQIDDNVDFISPVYFAVGLVENNHTLPGENALPSGTYFWRVRAVDNLGNTLNWSSFWTLFIIVGNRWMQTNWAGGPTKPSLQAGTWNDAYDNFYDNDNVNWLAGVRLDNYLGPWITNHVVISEFATRGPNSTGAYDEFIELYNPTSSAVDISSWNLNYYSSAPYGWAGSYAIIATFPPGASVPAFGFYLWADSTGYSSPLSGPTPDLSNAYQGLGDGSLSEPRGIRLRDASNTVIDTVLYGGAGGGANGEAEGGYTAPGGPTSGNTTISIERKAQSTSTASSMAAGGVDENSGNAYDSDNNYNDWVKRTSRNPQNSSSTLENPVPTIVPLFRSAGWFESSIYDAGSVVDWKSISWIENKPSGTSIIVKARTGGDNNPYDGGWSGWYTHNNNTENTSMPDNRYVQYRVELSTTDQNYTPVLLSGSVVIYYVLPDITPPEAPSLVSPTDGTITGVRNPTFVWTSVSDPSGVTYIIQVDNDSDFSSPEENVAGLTVTTYTSSVLADENYSWRVRAVDGAGNPSVWSSVRTLLISSEPYWMQTNWAGGPTNPSLQVGTWNPSYNNFYDNENVDWSAGVKLKLQPGGVYRNGWFDSSIFDAGSSANWGVVSWDADTPSFGGFNYTYVSSYAAVKGTVDNFENQKDNNINSWSTLAESTTAGEWTNLAAYPGTAGPTAACYAENNGVKYVYAFTGTLVYRYDIAAGTWTNIANTGVATTSGLSVVWDRAGKIYWLSGGNTSTFHAYNISSNTISAALATPALARYSNSGTTLAYDGGDNIYALLVSSLSSNLQSWIASYSISVNSWQILDNTRYGDTIEDTGTGSGLIRVGNYLYVDSSIFSDNRGHFLRYKVTDNTWNIMASLPNSGNPPLQHWDSGSGLENVGTNYIYANIGGSAQMTFFRFSISDNTWTPLENTPSALSGAGDRLASDGTYLYLVRAYTDSSFWRYVVASTGYSMEINENISSIPSADNYTLEMRYRLANTNDTFNVQVWNGSTWNTRGTLSSTSWTTWSYTLSSSENIGGKVQVKFVDANPSSTSQDNLLIDYLRVRSQAAQWSTSLVMKLRTGGDNDPRDGGWSEWYTHNNNTENTSMPANRYVQYRVELSTTDQNYTPVLLSGSVVINYTTASTVTNVTSTKADGSYGVGQLIPVTVTFSENVIVTGTPQLTLATGGAGTAVNWTSGSGTATLTFNYTVAAGDNSPDLDYVATTSLALNGGTIKDNAGNNATLTLPTPSAAGSLGYNKNIVIDTTAINPGVSVSISPSSQSGENGATLNYTVTVSNTGNVADNYTLDNTDTLAWILSLSNTSVVVPAFSSDNTTTLSVTIPANAIGGTVDNISVTANGTGVSDSASCTAQVSIPFSGSGSGTQADPYVITTLSQLQEMSNSLAAYYILGNDIDASATSGWNSGAGFEPIGAIYNPFTGSFDGCGYKIYNLCINRGGENYIGLYGYVGSGGVVEKAWLENENVVGGENTVGGLVGRNDGTVSNCYSTGSVSGNIAVGGLVGRNYYGTVSNCYSTSTSTGGSLSGASGGLVGCNYCYGTVSNCYATGTVSAYIAGGLVGYDWTGTVSNCYATGTVSGYIEVGGLVGDINHGTVSNCYATGPVSGSWYVGGLGGSSDGTVSNCYSTSTVSGYVQDVGGLLGANFGTVSNCYATGSVSGTADVVGGLVGWNENTMSNCYSTGTVSGNSVVGGLVGRNDRPVSNSFWDIETSGQSTSAGGTGKTTENMKNVQTFTDNTWSEGLNTPWDFVGNPYYDEDNNDIWNIYPAVNNGYPFLTALLTVEQQFTLQLVAGWNLVCFPVDSGPTTPSGIFTGLTWGVDYNIYSWTAPGGPYILIGPTDVLQDNLAYWVLVTADQTITWNGTQPTSRDVYLVTGWNMAGFPVVNGSTTPTNIFTGMTWGVDYNIYWWTAPGGPYILLGPTDLFLDNTGYWVYVNADKVVTVP